MNRWFWPIIGAAMGVALVLASAPHAHAAPAHQRPPLAACEARQRARYPADDPGPRPADTWTFHGGSEPVELPNTDALRRWEEAVRFKDTAAENAISHYCYGLRNGIGERLTERTVIVQTDDALIPITVY